MSNRSLHHLVKSTLPLVEAARCSHVSGPRPWLLHSCNLETSSVERRLNSAEFCLVAGQLPSASAAGICCTMLWVTTDLQAAGSLHAVSAPAHRSLLCDAANLGRLSTLCTQPAAAVKLSLPAQQQACLCHLHPLWLQVFQPKASKRSQAGLPAPGRTSPPGCGCRPAAARHAQTPPPARW